MKLTSGVKAASKELSDLTGARGESQDLDPKTFKLCVVNILAAGYMHGGGSFGLPRRENAGSAELEGTGDDHYPDSRECSCMRWDPKYMM